MNKEVYVDLSQQDVQDIINAYEKDIEKFNKQQRVLDKIKEYIKENACYDKNIKQCCRDLLTDECDYILELLEEIE